MIQRAPVTSFQVVGRMVCCRAKNIKRNTVSSSSSSGLATDDITLSFQVAASHWQLRKKTTVKLFFSDLWNLWSICEFKKCVLDYNGAWLTGIVNRKTSNRWKIWFLSSVNCRMRSCEWKAKFSIVWHWRSRSAAEILNCHHNGLSNILS